MLIIVSIASVALGVCIAATCKNIGYTGLEIMVTLEML